MTAYRISRLGSGIRVEDDGSPRRIVALIEPRLDRKGGLAGWRIRPSTIMRGPHTKVWPSPEAELVSFGLMTMAKARDAIAALPAPVN